MARAADASLCGRGRAQSPIDIDATQPQTGRPLRFEYRPVATRIVNDGHTVRLRQAAGSLVHLGSERLRLAQTHFHLPAGDRIHGESFPMAMHFLHRAPSAQLVALVLLFRLGTENAALARLLPRMPSALQPESEWQGPAPDPAAWLPTGPSSAAYFAYTGSLTAPPCTEGVRWIVLQQVQTLSQEQLDRLRVLIPEQARPVQPLNGRVVMEHP